MKYSILMYNFGNYEIMREPEEIDPEAEYIYVTDHPELYKNSKWKIIYDPKLENKTVYDKCCYVRYHPFEYVNTDIVFNIDGSTQINKSLRNIYDMFNLGNYDAAYCLNLWTQKLVDDYNFWIKNRNYSREQALKCLKYMCYFGGWDINYKGYIELFFRIVRNTPEQKEIDTMTYHLLKELGTSDEIERLDQVIYCYVLQKYQKQNILPFSRQLVLSQYLTRCYHNSIKPEYTKINIHKAWLYNKEYDIIEV